MKKLSILACLFCLVGCSYLRSNTERQTTILTNGVQVVVEKTSARGYTLFDANASLVKFRNSAGGTNNSGTFVSGLNESSTTTNLSGIVGAVAEGIVKGLK